MSSITEIIGFIKESWAAIVAIATGIGGYLSWRMNRRKSTSMLYDELEKLKQKVVLQVRSEVEHASEMAEKNRIIDGLRTHCPDCFDSYMSRYQNDGDEKG